MTPEKKNRTMSIVYLVIAALCLAGCVFLLINYINVKNKLKEYESSSSQTSYAERSEKAEEPLLLIYA